VPAKKKTPRKKRAEPPKDAAGDVRCYCGRARMPGSEFCVAHTVHDFLSDGSRRAAKRGKPWEAVLFGLGAAVTDNIHKHDLGQKAFVIYQMRQQQAQQAAQRKASKPDPFVVLRLDPKTATVEDVRRVQKRLALVYHTDKDESGVAGDAMQDINAAAAEAIEAIAKREGRF